MNNTGVRTQQTFFISFFYPHVHFIQFHTGMITDHMLTTKWIYLNSSIDYTLLIMDPKIWIFSEIHDIIPRFKAKIPKKVNVKIYIKVN